jgi:hypothetical protein
MSDPVPADIQCENCGRWCVVKTDVFDRVTVVCPLCGWKKRDEDEND